MHEPATETAPITHKPPAKRRAAKANRRSPHTSLDARTWQYKLLQSTKAEMLAHCGPKPSITQRALVERASWLTVYVAEMDAKATAGECMSDHASRQYLAWSNALARTLARLGLKGAAERGPTLAEHLARTAAK